MRSVMSVCAKKIAEESVVLLKNENRTLPLSPKIKSILIVGPLSDAPHDQLGTWTMDGETERTQTPVKALREMYGDKVKKPSCQAKRIVWLI